MNGAMQRLHTQHGYKTKFIYAADPSTYENTLKELGQAKTSIVVAPFASLQSGVSAVAPSYPNTKWIEIYGDPLHPSLPNVKTIQFDQYKAWYLSGILAATVTKSGRIGYVGGTAQPTLNADFHAYEAGAKSVKPNIRVTGTFAGSFDDPTKGASIASSMIAQGIDVIQTDAAATGNGVIKAAQAGKALVITELDQSIDSQYKNVVIANSFVNFGTSFTEEINKAVTSGWKGGAATSGLEDGTVGLSVSAPFVNSNSPRAAAVKAMVPKLTQVTKNIVSGSVTVPFNTSGI